MLSIAAMEEGKQEVRIISPLSHYLSFFNIISLATFRYPYALIILVSLMNLLIYSLAELHFFTRQAIKFNEHFELKINSD